MRNSRILVLILILFTTFSNSLFAGEIEDLKSEVQVLREELKTLQGELQTIKKTEPVKNSEQAAAKVTQDYVRQADLDQLKDILEEKINRGVSSKYTVNFSGFGILGYSSIRHKPDYFGLSSAGLTFTGNLREDPTSDGDLKYRVSLLAAGTPPSSANLTDVFLTWDLKTAKFELEPKHTFTLTLGQQLIPFGSDNLATEDKIPTIKKTQYLSSFGISRDIGLKAEGGIINRHDPASSLTTPLVAYTLGIFNGSGANKSETNDAKDLTAKIVIAPEKSYFSPFRGLKFGGSYYAGNIGKTGTALRKRRIGSEFEWLKKPFLVTGEYVWGLDQNTRSKGYVTTLFWTSETLPEFQPFVRFDSFDPNEKNIRDKKDIYSVGFNYFLYQVEPVTRRVYETKKTERVVKLQLNYNRIEQESGLGGDDEIIGQVVFNF